MADTSTTQQHPFDRQFPRLSFVLPHEGGRQDRVSECGRSSAAHTNTRIILTILAVSHTTTSLKSVLKSFSWPVYVFYAAAGHVFPYSRDLNAERAIRQTSSSDSDSDGNTNGIEDSEGSERSCPSGRRCWPSTSNAMSSPTASRTASSASQLYLPSFDEHGHLFGASIHALSYIGPSLPSAEWCLGQTKYRHIIATKK
ncbi:hypothetical protein P280DRAFT_481733 [Massarina eburnea CBS 473.64]|uniref:Uncharacterized protein n=1 Tax=Massarina eburnea CBS 473.64 TaxID=1395130 RepID=A0A6A6RTU1_9PLEO|nr:hypothetical protein P280DRAFT_481733 [Massarina eburnea CBS 473.64]